MSLTPPTLIILAGGASSRLAPLREKSLMVFGDEPLLVSQLRGYESLGFKEAVIVGNPQNEMQIRELFANSKEGMDVKVVVQETPKGMGDALLKAESALSNPDGAVYVNQVHDMVEERLHVDMLMSYRNNPQATYMAGIKMSEYFPGGYLIVGEDNAIKGIVEKPGEGNEPSDLVNIVAHIHESGTALFDALRHEYGRIDVSTDDHYERAMDALMQKQAYQVVAYDGTWSALKYPWHTLDIMNHFLNRIEGQTVSAGAFVAPSATLSGDVFIGEGAKIFAGASIVGPAYIGKNTIVGNNALVRHSMVLDNCNVGFTTEVARSYVASGCQMHACRVLDSVFAENVNFSAGCTTANLRIDKGNIPAMVKGDKLDTGRDKLGAIIGHDAFLGVDVMTMPGVKIGAKAEVGPGVHVRHDVDANVRVYVKQELVVVKKNDD